MKKTTNNNKKKTHKSVIRQSEEKTEREIWSKLTDTESKNFKGIKRKYNIKNNTIQKLYIFSLLW